ncbi:microcystin-dependent protein [Aurantimicrobium minutum]|nr:microcystin-dependent protein [Aurantimicrobium minutum]
MPLHNHGGMTSANNAYNDVGIYAPGGGTNFVPHTWAGAFVGGDSSYQAKTIHSHSISVQGGGGAHNNVQPTVAALLVIKT